MICSGFGFEFCVLGSGFPFLILQLEKHDKSSPPPATQRVDAGHDHDYDDHVGKCDVIPCSKIEARFHDRKRPVLCYDT